MRRVKVRNPGPAALMVLNPPRKGKRKMAVRKRSRRGARRKPVARRRTIRRNPAPHRAARRTHARRTVRRRTRRNPFMRRRSRRRSSRSILRRFRNPGSGLFAKGLALAAGAAGVQFVLGFVPPIGGVSPVADAARTAAVGWIAGIAMKKTGLLAKYGDDVMLAGFTLAGGKLISSVILPFANRLFMPKAAPSEEEAKAMNGIGFYYPGMQPFNRYAAAGMNGIGMYYNGMQPFNNYTSIPMV